MFGMRAPCQFLLILDQATVKIQSLFLRRALCPVLRNPVDPFDGLAVPDRCSWYYKGRFSTSFAVFVSSLNTVRLTHLFPACLRLLSQEPGKLSVLVFAFSDPA